MVIVPKWHNSEVHIGKIIVPKWHTFTIYCHGRGLKKMIDSPDIDTVLFDTMEAVSLGGCRVGSSKTDLSNNRERLAAGPVRTPYQMRRAGGDGDRRQRPR